MKRKATDAIKTVFLSNSGVTRKLEEKEGVEMRRFAISGYGPAEKVFQEIVDTPGRSRQIIFVWN